MRRVLRLRTKNRAGAGAPLTTAIALGLLTGVTFVATSVAQENPQLPPGVKRVCVPSSDGRRWVCGTTENPPQETFVPRSREQSPASRAPPPFLANPNASRATITVPTGEEPPGTIPDR